MKKKILFTPHAMARLTAYVQSAPGEVSGLGRVVHLPSGDLLVDEVALLKQETDYAGTLIGEETLAEFMGTLLDRGEDVGAWRCWWHAHGAFTVFWSDLDEETCRSFNNEWMISVVINKHGDVLGRVDVYKPFHIAAELPVGVHAALEEKELKAIEAEVLEKVGTPRWPSYRSDWWLDGDEQNGEYPGETSAEDRKLKGRDRWYVLRGRLVSFRKQRYSSRSD